MEIKSYTPTTLPDLVNSDRFAKLKHIPISYTRVLSQSKNPRTTANDPILFVAWEKEEVAGYIGVLADKIFIRGEEKKVGWGSCFWVDPVFRGKKIAGELFEEMMHSWNNNVIITNMNPGTLGFYIRTGHFHPARYMEGLRGYLRFNLAEILPPKSAFFQKTRPLLLLADFIANVGNGVRLLFYPGYHLDAEGTVEYVEKISNDTAAFMMEYAGKNLVRRGKAELDWIMAYPWLTEGVEGLPETRRYYFSTVTKRFFYQRVEFRDPSGDLAAFLMLSVRNHHLTVPFCFCKPGVEKELVKFLFNTMLDFHLNMLTVFNPRLCRAIREAKSPFLFKKKVLRPYFIPTTLDIPGLDFQDGDGDSVFT